ncbi:MAG: hypothetical protein KME08_17785, partial [Aphanothece sp. CMT-3BRIN-NPC111]|nr:hypothetical protein [Aphanothece sp. CMT-3BRIN-NPC111]
YLNSQKPGCRDVPAERLYYSSRHNGRVTIDLNPMCPPSAALTGNCSKLIAKSRGTAVPCPY